MELNIQSRDVERKKNIREREQKVATKSTIARRDYTKNEQRQKIKLMKIVKK